MNGPVDRPSITIERDEHGRAVHTFRQSALNEAEICHERARLTMTGEMPPDETDPAAQGTAVHAGIEAALRSIMDRGEPLMLPEIQEVGRQTFAELEPILAWKKYKPEQCRRFIVDALEVFYDELYPKLAPVGVEIPFHHLVIHEDDERVIRISGTMDYLDANIGLVDWKSAGDDRKYKRGFGGQAWEIERWALQPTVYTKAARELSLVPSDGPWPFTYFAFVVGKTVTMQRLEVSRHEGDHAWLVEKCLGLAELAEAQLGVWPKNETSAMCSEKWCPAWDQCRGRHYAEGWPKPSAPRGVDRPTSTDDGPMTFDMGGTSQ